MYRSFAIALCLAYTTSYSTAASSHAAAAPRLRVATFQSDVTLPIGHWLYRKPLASVEHRLLAKGIVLDDGRRRYVLCAVDWCEIRNGAYDQWRAALARAAGTTRERVLVSSLHQHDAPVTDRGAAQLLAKVGLKGELYDEQFHDRTVERVATALKNSLESAAPVTHLGTGQARPAPAQDQE